MFQVLFIAAIIGVYLYTTLRHQHHKMNRVLYWALALLTLLALRYPYILGPATNQDEMQWLVSAASMQHSFSDWCSYFSAYDISRLFTILPLMVVAPVLGLSSVVTAHITAVIFTWLFTLINYRTLKLLFTRNAAIIACGLFITVPGLTPIGDFVAYNSEYPATCLISLATLLLVSISKRPEFKPRLLAFLLGLVCSWIPFAKEQALLIALLTTTIAYYQLASTKNWKAIIYMTSGAIIGSLVALSPVILSGNLANFLIQIQQGVAYGKHGLPASLRQQHASGLTRMLLAYWWNIGYLLPMSLGIAGILVCLFSFLKKQEAISTRISIFYGLIFLCTLYTLYLPGNFFSHYGILLWTPVIFFVTVVFSIPGWRLTPAYTLLLLALMQVGISLFFGGTKVKSPEKKDLADDYLNQYARPGDGIIIWGWNNSIYLKHNLRRASCYLYPDGMLRGEKSREVVKQYYMQDMLHFKPRLVLELVGEGRFYFKDTTVAISNSFPQLRQHLNRNYHLVGSGTNFKLYLRK